MIIKNKALRDQYNVVYDNYHFDYNYIGIEALITCYNDCEYYVDQQNAYFWKNIQIVRKFPADTMPEVKLIEPEGTYLLWIDFRAWKMDQEKLLQLFKDYGVRLNNGTNYGATGVGFIRLNVATQTGGFIIVSGQLPIDPETGEMPEGIAGQTRQSLRNVKSILEAAGYTMDDILRCGVFLDNMDDFGAMNEVYGEFFSGEYPARAAVEAAKLPKAALVEIEAIAYK